MDVFRTIADHAGVILLYGLIIGGFSGFFLGNWFYGVMLPLAVAILLLTITWANSQVDDMHKREAFVNDLKSRCQQIGVSEAKSIFDSNQVGFRCHEQGKDPVDYWISTN